MSLFFIPDISRRILLAIIKKEAFSKWASFIRATGSDKTRSFSFRELVLSPVSTLNSNGIPGPWARATLDVSHGGNWPPEGKEFERVTRTRRQDVLLPSTRHIASRRKKNKRPRMHERARDAEEAMGWKKSKGEFHQRRLLIRKFCLLFPPNYPCLYAFEACLWILREISRECRLRSRISFKNYIRLQFFSNICFIIVLLSIINNNYV